MQGLGEHTRHVSLCDMDPAPSAFFSKESQFGTWMGIVISFLLLFSLFFSIDGRGVRCLGSRLSAVSSLETFSLLKALSRRDGINFISCP